MLRCAESGEKEGLKEVRVVQGFLKRIAYLRSVNWNFQRLATGRLHEYENA